jgi:hypothetical protein
VGDVGQGAREEIDLVTLAGNYGWRVFEGTLCTGLDPASCGSPGFIGPVAEYDHSAGRCSITGGYVYRGMRGTLPLGSYVYGDFCTGEIFRLPAVAPGAEQTLLLDTTLSISSFGEDEGGEIYVVDLGAPSIGSWREPRRLPLRLHLGLSPRPRARRATHASSRPPRSAHRWRRRSRRSGGFAIGTS